MQAIVDRPCNPCQHAENDQNLGYIKLHHTLPVLDCTSNCARMKWQTARDVRAVALHRQTRGMSPAGRQTKGGMSPAGATDSSPVREHWEFGIGSRSPGTGRKKTPKPANERTPEVQSPPAPSFLTHSRSMACPWSSPCPKAIVNAPGEIIGSEDIVGQVPDLPRPPRAGHIAPREKTQVIDFIAPRLRFRGEFAPHRGGNRLSRFSRPGLRA
jgi:hypothetical protein